MTIVSDNVGYDELLSNPDALVQRAAVAAERSVREEAGLPEIVRQVTRRNLMRWLDQSGHRHPGARKH